MTTRSDKYNSHMREKHGIEHDISKAAGEILNLRFIFSKIETALVMNAIRGDTVALEEVVKTIAQTQSISITVSHVQQILHIWPEAYTITWKFLKERTIIVISTPIDPDTKKTSSYKTRLELFTKFTNRYLTNP